MGDMEVTVVTEQETVTLHPDLVRLQQEGSDNAQYAVDCYVRAKAQGRVSKEQQEILTAQVVTAATDVILVRHGHRYYMREHGATLFRKMDEQDMSNLCRRWYINMWGIPTGQKLQSAINTLEANIMAEIEEIDDRYIQITETLLWDTEVNGFLDVSDMNNSPVVFRKLFDTKHNSKHTVKVPDFGDEEENLLQSRYHSILHELENDAFVEHLEPLRTWSDGNHDVYLDIMRCLASIFTKKKPVGSFLLIGPRRNGKSAFVGMVRTLLGDENCSAVRMSQLGDPHIANTLATAMFNAPDEEDDTMLKEQALFKTMCDHGDIFLPVLYSQEPLKVACDFMCAFPMNHMPQFKGSGAAACITRSLVIPFYADLSKFDKQNYNFAEETFTTEFMIELLANTLAYATYYSSHPWEFSETMDKARQNIEEEVESMSLYRKSWEKYFDGFQSFNQLYDDYVNWCKIHDYKINRKVDCRMQWMKYLSNKKSYRVPESAGKIIRIHRIECGKNLMSDYSVAPMTHHSLVALHNSEIPQSIVAEMEELDDEAHSIGKQRSIDEEE